MVNVRAWRRYFFVCVVLASTLWAFFGWDSTWECLKPYIDYFSLALVNHSLLFNIPWGELYAQSRLYYGTGNHFSAPVIYGSAFIVLSLWLERVGIRKSMNFIFSTALSFFNIGVFEWTWNLLYAHLQAQPWVITFRWKQASNLSYFTSFIILGALGLLYLHQRGFRVEMNRLKGLLLVLTVCAWVFWVFYPFEVEGLSVETTAGVWTSGRLFPQTFYAVDLDPSDGVAVGQPFFVENDLLHGVNVLCKTVTCLFILSCCMVEETCLKKSFEGKRALG